MSFAVCESEGKSVQPVEEKKAIFSRWLKRTGCSTDTFSIYAIQVNERKNNVPTTGL